MHHNAKHGHARRKGGYSPTYYSWRNMLTRIRGTSNKKDRKFYAHVSCDPRWYTFSAFLKDMGERPTGTSLDRIDRNKGYTPDNCRWADRKTQSRNTKLYEGNVSGVPGVIWLKRDRRWRANITVDGKFLYLGTYHTKEEAIEARKAGEKKYWGGE